jgi:hypothetical protein
MMCALLTSFDIDWGGERGIAFGDPLVGPTSYECRSLSLKLRRIKRGLPSAIPWWGPTNESKPSLRAGPFSLPLAFESKLSTLVKTKMPLTGL